MKCQELQRAWTEAHHLHEIEELIAQMAKNHADEAEHVVVLALVEVSKDDPTILNVTSSIFRPPVKFINITFIV